eukprot:TRINITY_DN23242_c0_g1_i1.p1 TRINITY_DN23242_c0_g1~~TRINITY_DN23242_c0_g1_i1.p1  ORF type:complete len:307 (+),score=48.14 TRINITY_DN23242_c0_g1_i1:59-979(+)
MTDQLIDVNQYLDKWTEQQCLFNKRDVLTYAVGIGCTELRWVYEKHDDFAVFPTFPINLLFKGSSLDVVSFPSPAMKGSPAASLPLFPGVKVGLDGERYIEKVRDLDPGGIETMGALRLRQSLVAVHKREKGASIEQLAELCDSKGTVYYRIITSSFLVGATGFKPAGRAHFEKVETPARAPDAVEEWQTSPYQAQVYRLSGDYNPLHVDPDVARKGGFEKPIMHGLCTMGITARAVVKHFCDNEARKFKAIKVRFAKPVLPGQTLRVEMWKENARVIMITKVKETGAVVINNAFVDLNVSPAARL